jgi:glycosyltransferase involved in cell wall biosynthesis
VKLVIDAREAFCKKKAGKGQWTKGFLEELNSRDIDLTALTHTSQSVGSSVAFSGKLFWHLAAAKYARISKTDYYISPTSYIAPYLIGKKVPCVPIIHDLIAFQNEPHEKRARFIEKLLIKKVVMNATNVCTVSEATRKDVLKKFPHLSPSSVTAIYAGPMRDNMPLSVPDKKTILCVGTLCPRKNQERLIQAYDALPHTIRSQYRLVLVGARGWHDAEILRLARVTDGVEWKDYVSDDEYQVLLSTATVFAYPSLYEGFGMQVLDALQRGIPILTSDRGSLSEVVGDTAVVVDPTSVRSITSGLIALLENADIRNILASNGPIQASRFSWKRTVDLFLKALNGAV